MIQYKRCWRRVAVVALALVLPAVLKAKTYIVCVGMQNYPGLVNDTHLCVKDAESVKWLYDKHGDAETLLLTDKQATKAQVAAAMRKLFAKAKPADAVAIFYSGHGDRGALCLYDGNLSYQTILSIFQSSKAKRRFAFINACYSGTMRNKNEVGELKGKNVMFLLSSRSGETSQEELTMKNGVFPTFLMQGLRGSADANKDRVITARELYDYVNSKVIERTQNEQHPVAWGHFPDDMPVMTWKNDNK